MAANCVFGWPIRSDLGSPLYAPALSGGSWLAAMPLANVQTAELQDVARSTDATLASTQFETDLGVARALRVLAVYIANPTQSATVRFRVSNAAGSYGSPIYDSGAISVFPSGHDAETTAGMNLWGFVVPSADKTGRYVLTEISDTANPDGYVDVGRLVLAAGWQPSINMAVGADVGLESGTTSEDTDAFTTVYTERDQRRTWQFTIPNIDPDEAFGSAFDMQRIAGLASQLFFVFDPDDTDHKHRRSGLCTLRRQSRIEFPFADLNSVPFELVEVL